MPTPPFREFGLLGRLRDSGIPVPEPVWLDAPGLVLGMPTMVMTRLPGRPLVDPKDLPAWVGQLGRSLAALHAVPRDRFAGLPLDASRPTPSDVRWEGLDALMAGSATSRAAIVAAAQGRPPGGRSAEPRLIHWDFWPGNTLWVRGRLTGIVDWSTGQIGQPEYDVGYCRLDISLSVGAKAADEFMDAYRRASGRSMENQWFWDLQAASRALPDPSAWIPAWRDLGREDLTPGLLRDRLRAFIEVAARQAGS
jgi:aminoglycoside phosphotransferase (APT) family kinase protein